MTKEAKACFKRMFRELAAVKIMMFVILLANLMLAATLVYFIVLI